jgi:hypothetical protein
MEVESYRQRQDAMEQLERILQSRALQGSENLKSFLKYVVLNSISESKEPLKEYTIATDVFGRSEDFNPRHDSVVRVQAKRLRDKLQEYYTNEGKTDHVLIELPKGHYDPVFSFIDPQTETSQGREVEGSGEVTPADGRLRVSSTIAPQQQPVTQPLASPEDRSLADRRWIVALGTTVGVLAVISVILALSNRGLHQRVREIEARNDSSRFGLIWRPFLESGDALLVLSNPITYRFVNPMDPNPILDNSVSLSSDQIKHINEAAAGRFMTKHGAGRITLSMDEYTGIGEAIGLARITELFRMTGRGVLIKQSRTVSPEDLKNHSVILLGSVWVNEWSGKLPIKEDFTYTPNATILNHNPQSGEEHEYRPRFDESGRLIEDYGLITVKPNISDKFAVIVVAGIHSEGTEAAAEFITNPDYLKDINERLRLMAGPVQPPKYYQALLRVSVDNGMPTIITLLSVHELAGQSD